MNNVRQLLLGGACVFAVVAAGPANADSVEYVKICSLYGAGFYYVPGTDICLKMGGYVRTQYFANYGGTPNASPYFDRQLNTRSVTDDSLSAFRFRSQVTFDTRQQTEYGTLRTYMSVGWTQDFINNTASQLYANRAFIQFAGFTFGKATSFFDIYSTTGTSYFPLMASDTTETGWGVAAYTWQFGNGVSGTISAEEARRSRIVNGTVSAGIPFGPLAPNSYADFKYPDVVASLRVDQAWGSAQIMAALHDASASYYGTTTNTGHPADKLGWAVGFGGVVNTGFVSPGDKFSFQVAYAEGAIRYINFLQADFGNAAYAGSGNSVGWGFVGDGIYDLGPGGQQRGINLTKTWGINAAYNHRWNNKWQTSIYGGYNKTWFGGSFNEPGSAASQVCLAQTWTTVAATQTATATACNPDWSMAFIGSRTQWNLTPSFYIGADVIYTRLNTSLGGTAISTPGGARPSGLYVIEDQDTVSVTFRAQRDFLP